jgi:hypothetical protein
VPHSVAGIAPNAQQRVSHLRTKMLSAAERLVYQRIQQNDYRERNRGRINAYKRIWMKEYRAAYPERELAIARKYKSKHPERVQAAQRKRIYGMGSKGFDEFVKQQGGGCAICGNQDWAGHTPHVDHDHVTGNVRGILCRLCNTALGMIKDNPKTALAMATYLEKHGHNT